MAIASKFKLSSVEESETDIDRFCTTITGYDPLVTRSEREREREKRETEMRADNTTVGKDKVY
jgi:hypothetical protein